MGRTVENIQIPDIPKLEGMTSQEYIYGRIKRALMIGVIPPSSLLSIRGLVSMLGTSATPIREAIRRLSSEQALEILDNRRICVPEMTKERFLELLNLRITLETHAALSAEPYISPILIEQMLIEDKKADEAILNNNFEDAVLYNQKFHRILYTANPNQVVMSAVESLWLQLGPFQKQIAANGYQYYKVDRHKEILSALRAHDAKGLKIAIIADIKDALEKAGNDLLSKQ